MDANIQVSRWAFTLHRYNETLNYKDYLSTERFGIKRAILGFESLNNQRNSHIQGYIELRRSRRLAFVINILPTAHWQRAVGTPLQNYNYCSKSKVFELIGDWTKEQRGVDCNTSNLIIKGLLSDYAPQVKCSKEYMLRNKAYDEAAGMVSSIRSQHRAFNDLKNCKLSNWQFDIFKELINQPDRIVLWVCDKVGNTGKTFICKFLRVMYNFFVSDGTLDSRDLCYMFPEKISGIIFDVCRNAEGKFNYEVLEGAKNGFLVSGKYEGKVRCFKRVPVGVFANFLPDVSKLSADRWKIVELGKGQ